MKYGSRNPRYVNNTFLAVISLDFARHSLGFDLGLPSLTSVSISGAERVSPAIKTRMRARTDQRS